MTSLLRRMLLPGALLFLLSLLAFSFQGSRGLYSPDEGHYAGIAHNMIQSGDYLLPRLNQELWLDKPPLTMWGVTAGMFFLGQNEWGARLFHGLCFMLTVLMVFLSGKALRDKAHGILGATVYATMVLPFVSANIISTDTPLTLWTTLALYCFWRSVEPEARHIVLWKMAMCAVFGLGFLTKGPAALVPAGALFLFLIIKRRTRRYFLTWWSLAGLALFLIMGVSWYALVAHAVPGALAYFLDNEVLGRVLSARYARTPGLRGALIYVPTLILGALPWSLFWLPRSGIVSREFSLKSSWHALRDDSPNLLLFVWVAAPLVLLVLVPEVADLFEQALADPGQ